MDACNRDSFNAAFGSNVTRLSVEASIEQLIQRSSTIVGLVDRGKVAIVGAIYDNATGRVDFL